MKTYQFNKSVLAIMVAIMLCIASTASAKVTAAQAQQVAENRLSVWFAAGHFLWPALDFHPERQQDNKVYVGTNRFSFVRKKITPDFPIVTPNATTLYGSHSLIYKKNLWCWKCRRSRIVISASSLWINTASIIPWWAISSMAPRPARIFPSGRLPGQGSR